jgi:hypothetical protein
MVQVDIEPEALKQVGWISQEAADLQIRHANEDREREAGAANTGKDMDNFRYLSHRWFILKTQHGDFVASIQSVGGGGRVSLKPDPGDYCDAFIRYNLHFRIGEP